MPDHLSSIASDLTTAARSVRLADGLAPRGVVRRVGDGVAAVAGLENVRYEELLAFDSGAYGIAFDLRSDELGAVLLATVVILEMTGSSSDPLLPASAAFLIGCTAVLDRVGVRELE